MLKYEEVINLKIKQFNEKNISIEYNDILRFLENIYFKHNEKTKENLDIFLQEDNLEVIVSYLMSEAMINPKF